MSHTSEAQLVANRANSQKSTGPVTAAGQARSALNALKTGLTGKTVLLPYEDANAYQAELEYHNEKYQPATEEELRLVQSILDCVWRMNRINRIETGVLLKGYLEFASRYEDQPTARRDQLIYADAYLKYEKQIRNLNIQEARIRRVMEKDKAELTRLQTARRREEAKAPQPPIAKPKPELEENGFEFSSAPATTGANQTEIP